MVRARMVSARRLLNRDLPYTLIFSEDPQEIL